MTLTPLRHYTPVRTPKKPKKTNHIPSRKQKKGQKQDQHFMPSLTRTLTKLDEEMQNTGQHADMSLKHFVINLPGRSQNRGFKKAGQFSYMYEYTSPTLTNVVGNQQSGIGNYHLGRTQLIGPVGTAGNSINAFAVNPFDLNPNQFTSGSVYNAAGRTPAADFLHLHHSTNMLLIGNRSANIPTWLEIHWLVAATGHSLDPNAAWDSCIADLRLGQGGSSNPASVATSNAVTTGYATRLTYGETPFSIPAFSKLWRKVHSEVLVLQPGDQRKFAYRINYNRTIDKSFVTNSSTEFIKGLSVVPLIIMRPGLMYCATAAGDTTNIETIGVTSISFLAQQKYFWDGLSRQSVTTETVTPCFLQSVENSKTVNDVDQIVTEAANIAQAFSRIQ